MNQDNARQNAQTTPSPGHQWAILALTAALVLWALSPGFRTPPQDSFPFSNYPMFAAGKPEQLRLGHILGQTASGSLIPLSPAAAAGNSEVLQAKGVIEDAISRGEAEQLCREAASRLGAPCPYEKLLVATSVFDTVAYFDNGGQALSRHIYATCPCR